ncbi:hypothetical protein NP233_g402 [Leucocoprinus birnbaumii]|uniref:Protein kinase domain-containing protein n=1 Tax=Leucocoprinus birnbaumii TaxID=56174 RepID=A0AAD5W3U0_9AGAR|nr:hypothetical protein NP233_g402 [Leucocoprinus birnbaumii]
MDFDSLARRDSAVELELHNEADIFALLHHLVSRIDTEDRMQQAIDKARALEPQDIQLLVDCLSMALDKNAAPLRCRGYIWRMLIKVASSARVFAQNHTLRSKCISSVGDSSPGVYSISSEPPLRVQVLRQVDETTDQSFDEKLLSWSHFSHPNISPMYAMFLEDRVYPALVHPCITGGSICDYARQRPEVSRLRLISDIADAMCYMHQLGIAHGGLSPQTVVIDHGERVLIMGLEIVGETQGSYGQSSARYSAPELFGEDDFQPTEEADIWSLACLSYELLSGKTPFYQITNDFKVSGAIARGAKPIRPGPGQGGVGELDDDVLWPLLMMCWEYEPEDRPSCLRFHQILSGMDIKDVRSVQGPLIVPDFIKCSTIDVERAKASLATVLGCDEASSPRVPEELRRTLFKLIPNTVKFEATAIAAKKLSPDDTECLVNFLDLVLEDLPYWTGIESQATQTLLSKIMMSTYIIPQRYQHTGLQYDSQAPIAEGSFGKAFQGRDMRIRVNVVTNSSNIRGILRSLSDWSRSSHPNVISFYGVFHQVATEIRQLCVITPLWQKGTLREFAPSLPQKARMPLILDVIKGLSYVHGESIVYGAEALTPDKVMVSDEGRAILACYESYRLFSKQDHAATLYELRFAAPNASSWSPHDIWSFGCFCYDVLTRKPPYYQYSEATQIQAALSRGELPKRPDYADEEIDEIDGDVWKLVEDCCQNAPGDRPTAGDLLDRISSMEIEDNRPKPKEIPETDILMSRSRANVDSPRVETILGKIQVELLRSPLSKLIQSRTKAVAAAAANLTHDDTQTFADFLDLTLKDHLSISDERNRVLALLSRITSSTRIFPTRYEIKGIKYNPTPIAEGGFGTVHEGIDHKMCVKVMTRVDLKALTEWIKELILWAHSSHPNVLPFYGVFLESVGGLQRICLVSPFMKNGTLHDYAPRLPQKSRLPLISDVINGLQYIHILGIVHSDLKGQNVLISDEGRGFITDFGASHIITTTATATTSSVHSTLRFAAPELMQDGAQPSKECDVWSNRTNNSYAKVFSRRPPYYQYARDFQVAAALSRKELPKRLCASDRDDTDEAGDDNWDDDDDDDWDTIDDQGWNLITKCCAPEPEDRAKISTIQELIADMKVWDDRPPLKAVPGAEIFKLRLEPEINLTRVGEILDELQAVVAPTELSPEEDFANVWNQLITEPQ